jgi:large subunit ribosomal protein L25
VVDHLVAVDDLDDGGCDEVEVPFRRRSDLLGSMASRLHDHPPTARPCGAVQEHLIMELTLSASTGRTTGSRPSTRLRDEGKVPGVVYGLGKDSLSVEVEWTELRRVLTTEAGMNALIDLEVDGERELAMVKDMQRHPVKRNILHVDFLRLDRNAPVAVEVPVLIKGFAKDVEDRRGIVDQQMKTLTVNAKPADIPAQLEADIDGLVIGGVITVADIALPAGVSTDVPADSPVVVGVATRFTVLVDQGLSLDTGEAEQAAGAEAAAEGTGDDAGA